MGHLPLGTNAENESMDVFDTRRERLREVMRERFDNKQALLAHAAHVAPDYVSRMLSVPAKKGHKRISGDFARELETALNLPRGYLDGELSPIPLRNELKATPVMDFSPEAWEFAREWHKLAEGPEKASIRSFLRMSVGEQERAKRPPQPAKGEATSSIRPGRPKADRESKNTLSSRKKPHGDPTH